MINDLADEDLRGRYNAVFNLSAQIGQILGPAITGWLLGGGNGTRTRQLNEKPKIGFRLVSPSAEVPHGLLRVRLSAP